MADISRKILRPPSPITACPEAIAGQQGPERTNATAQLTRDSGCTVPDLVCAPLEILGGTQSSQINSLTTSTSQSRSQLPWIKEPVDYEVRGRSKETKNKKQKPCPSWDQPVCRVCSNRQGCGSSSSHLLASEAHQSSAARGAAMCLRVGLLECSSVDLAPGRGITVLGCGTWIPVPLLRQCLQELKLVIPGLSLQRKPGGALEKAGLS